MVISKEWKNIMNGWKQNKLLYNNDKLISSGIINYGDFITNDNLTDYGNNELRFKKLKGNRFYVEF